MLGIFALLIGCATPSRDEIIDSIAPTSVKVLSKQEISVFVGDVELVWFSHVAEPLNEPGKRYVLVGPWADCPMAVPDQAYSVRVARQRINFGIRSEADKALMSDQVIQTCEAIPR